MEDRAAKALAAIDRFLSLPLEERGDPIRASGLAVICKQWIERTERLRFVLRFYASEACYQRVPEHVTDYGERRPEQPSLIEQDRGAKARAALEESQ